MSLRQADLSEKQQQRLTGGFSWSPRLPACRLRGLWGPLRQASAFQTVGRSYCKPGVPGARGGRPVTDAPLPGSSAVRSGQRDRVRRAALGLESVGTKRPREKGGQGGTPRNSHDETGRGLGGRGLTFSCAKNHGSHASRLTAPANAPWKDSTAAVLRGPVSLRCRARRTPADAGSGRMGRSPGWAGRGPESGSQGGRGECCRRGSNTWNLFSPHLEAPSLNSGCRQGRAPPEASRGGSSLPPPGAGGSRPQLCRGLHVAPPLCMPVL